MNDEGKENFAGFQIQVAGTTHVGRKRLVNQDAFDRFDSPNGDEILLIVADGLGGHRGGEIASKMAVGTLGKICFEEEGDAKTRLTLAIERANAEIFRRASKDHTLRGMGTTLVALLLRPNAQAILAHVGDSRIYRHRLADADASDDGVGAGAGKRIFEPLTEDHSVVALMVREGTISPEEARDHPKRNQIMRALGVHEEVEIDFAEHVIDANDSFLLCSDGLHSLIEDDDIAAIAEGAPDVYTAVAWMVDAANQAGGTDNITALFVRFEGRVDENDGCV